MKDHNHKRQFEVIRSAAGLGTDEDPQAHSFSTGLGEVSISRVTNDRFMVRDDRLGLFIMCEREHIMVERWPFDSANWQPGGAQLVFTGAGGLRVVLCKLNPEDAPRLAWFVGVELREGDE